MYRQPAPKRDSTPIQQDPDGALFYTHKRKNTAPASVDFGRGGYKNHHERLFTNSPILWKADNCPCQMISFSYSMIHVDRQLDDKDPVGIPNSSDRIATSSIVRSHSPSSSALIGKEGHLLIGLRKGYYFSPTTVDK